MKMHSLRVLHRIKPLEANMGGVPQPNGLAIPWKWHFLSTPTGDAHYGWLNRGREANTYVPQKTYMWELPSFLGVGFSARAQLNWHCTGAKQYIWLWCSAGGISCAFRVCLIL